jgi:Putative zinc-finger
MMLGHSRLRRQVALFGAGALDGTDAARVQAHLVTCARCRTELDETRSLFTRLERDPLRAQIRQAAPDIPFAVFAAQVDERVGRPRRRTSPRWRWELLALPGAAAAALAAWVLLPEAVDRFRTDVRPRPKVVAEVPVVSDQALARLERNVSREQAARYLADAQDVLVNVVASSRDCDRQGAKVDVEAEARRSRELLARATLLVEPEEDSLSGARPVLEDVEQMLHEVAALEACVHVRDVERLRQLMERRQLLMKMRLMQRELQG